MFTVDQLIARLGGSAAVSRATGWPLTTIEGWREVNFVPTWRQGRLIELAADTDEPITAEHFPPISGRKSRARPTEPASEAA